MSEGTIDPKLYHLATERHKKEFDSLVQQRDDLLAALKDIGNISALIMAAQILEDIGKDAGIAMVLRSLATNAKAAIAAADS